MTDSHQMVLQYRAAPRICCLIGRICCLRQSISNGRVEASVIQRSLEAAGENTPHGMSLADRRDFISNVLVTRKVVAKDVDSSTSMELERKKSDLIISPSLSSRIDMPGEEDDDEVKLLKACTICLIEYQDDEEIYWSHNEQCNHVFHKGCIVEWLLRHNGCPCCRHNFLSLNDEEAQLEVENSTFVENMP